MDVQALLAAGPDVAAAARLNWLAQGPALDGGFASAGQRRAERQQHRTGRGGARRRALDAAGDAGGEIPARPAGRLLGHGWPAGRDRLRRHGVQGSTAVERDGAGDPRDSRTSDVEAEFARRQERGASAGVRVMTAATVATVATVRSRSSVRALGGRGVDRAGGGRPGCRWGWRWARACAAAWASASGKTGHQRGGRLRQAEGRQGPDRLRYKEAGERAGGAEAGRV